MIYSTFETNTIHVSLYCYVLLKEFLGKSNTSIHTVNTGFTFKSLYLNKSIFVLIFHHFFLFPCVSRPYNLFELRSNQNGTIYYFVWLLYYYYFFYKFQLIRSNLPLIKKPPANQCKHCKIKIIKTHKKNI